jgi:hypothetical protein
VKLYEQTQSKGRKFRSSGECHSITAIAAHASIEIMPIKINYYQVSRLKSQHSGERNISLVSKMYRTNGGGEGTSMLTCHRHNENNDGSNALSTILTWAVWTHACCYPNQNLHHGAVQLLLMKLLPSAHRIAIHQQPCAQISVAAGYATHACRTVLQLCTKRSADKA